MGRFLFTMSYVGTRFSGVQMQSIHGIQRYDVKTVQGCLVRELGRIMGQVLFVSRTSSRTDAGVHALSNKITVDLPDRRRDGNSHDLILLQRILNSNLTRKGHEMRIHKIQQVDDDFIPYKMPFRRKYVYRLGIMRDATHSFVDVPLPLMEFEYAHILFPPFDMDKFIQGAEIMCGTHNFLSFTSEKVLKEKEEHGIKQNSIKHVNLNIRRSAPFIGDLNKNIQDKLEFWEVHITSKSYMYKQIRRMVGGLIKIASGHCSQDDLKRTLADPDNNKIAGFTKPLPPSGLFLTEVEYHPKDLVYRGPMEDLKKEHRKLSQTLELYLSEISDRESESND